MCDNGYTALMLSVGHPTLLLGGLEMSDENADENTPPPPPPGLPLAPPAPPGLEAPPAPPGLEAPPAPPDAPPAPPGLEAPPAPPDAPPAPPGMDDDDGDDELSDPMDLLGDMADHADEEIVEDVQPTPPGMDLLAPPVEDDSEDESADHDEVEIPPLDLIAPEPADDDIEVVEEVLAPVVAAPSLAGGRIRAASDVDAIPGDKLIATLSEVETSTLNPNGSVVKQDVSGVLTLNNPSSKDRLWDIDVILSGMDYADISQDLPFSELEAGADQSVDYSVEGPRMLSVKERIDTNPSRDQESSLSLERMSEAQEIHLEIEVENIGPVTLNDIVVTRVFPIQIQVEDSDSFDKQGDTITWNVGKLSSGENKILQVPTSVTAEAIDSIDVGAATATYSAEATLSGMGFSEVDALCRGFSYMVVDEDERPDNYRCQAVFENRSSFTVDLTKLNVQQTEADSPLFEIEDVDDDVLPDGRWESGVEVVHSLDKPTFSQELLYTVIPRVSLATEGNIELHSHVIEVLESEITKSYSLDVLRHYRETEMTATMEIENTGSATINLLRITDDIPGIFSSPDPDSVTASIDGHELIRDQYRIELKDGISIEKNRISPDGPGHTMLITIGTQGPIGLAPGRKMCVTYPLVAPDPSPANDVIAAPARIDFSSERFGPVATRGLSVVPAVRVTHRKVNYDSGKEVFPAGGAGRYEAMIMFNNRADSALQDVVIHDVIPGAFELIGWSVKSSAGEKVDVDMVEESIKDGKKMSWNIGTVGRGERIEVTYEFKGDASAGFKVSDAQEIHGIDVGAEIVDDLEPIEDIGMDEPEEDEDNDSAEDVDEAVEETSDDDSETHDDDNDDSDDEDDSISEEDDEAPVDDVDSSDDVDDGPVNEEDAVMNDALAKLTGGESESSVDDNSDGWECPICQNANDSGSTSCTVCSYDRNA